jgi:hypothetical protein
MKNDRPNNHGAAEEKERGEEAHNAVAA